MLGGNWMKNGKRPSRNQRRLIVHAGLNPNNWLIIKNLPEEMHLVHRETGTQRVIPA